MWAPPLASPPPTARGLPSPTAQGLPPLPSTTPTCACCAVAPRCLEEELLEPRRRPTTRTSPHSTSEWSDHRQVRYCPACGELHPPFSSFFRLAHLPPPFSLRLSLILGGDPPFDQQLCLPIWMKHWWHLPPAEWLAWRLLPLANRSLARSRSTSPIPTNGSFHKRISSLLGTGLG